MMPATVVRAADMSGSVADLFRRLLMISVLKTCMPTA